MWGQGGGRVGAVLGQWRGRVVDGGALVQEAGYLGAGEDHRLALVLAHEGQS